MVLCPSVKELPSVAISPGAMKEAVVLRTSYLAISVMCPVAVFTSRHFAGTPLRPQAGLGGALPEPQGDRLHLPSCSHVCAQG